MRHRSADPRQAMTALVDERLKLIATTRLEDVAGLAKVSSEDVDVDGRKVALSVWHEALVDGGHLVVVQAYRPWILGLGRMHADGFVVDKLNRRRPATREELAPFL